MRYKQLTFYHLFTLALIQGITEFLPVSSSGHLILLPRLTNFSDQGLLIDVSVHIGTLIAVVVYFWKDSLSLIKGFYDLTLGDRTSKSAKLVKFLTVATIPVIILGLIFKLTDFIEVIRNIKVIGYTMIIFGVILYLADRLNSNTRTEPNNYPKDAIVLGLWQSIALIPGTSRSGVTITAARILGYERKNAARIAMLMSIPTILASGTVEIADIWYQANLAHLSDAVVVSLLSFIFAFFALALMMKLLKSINFTPYVVYRVALGILLLFIAYT